MFKFCTFLIYLKFLHDICLYEQCLVCSILLDENFNLYLHIYILVSGKLYCFTEFDYEHIHIYLYNFFSHKK